MGLIPPGSVTWADLRRTLGTPTAAEGINQRVASRFGDTQTTGKYHRYDGADTMRGGGAQTEADRDRQWGRARRFWCRYGAAGRLRPTDSTVQTIKAPKPNRLRSLVLCMVEDRGFEPLPARGVTTNRTPAEPRHIQHKSPTEQDVAPERVKGTGDISPTPSEQVSDPSLRQKCALCVHSLEESPALARLVKAWPGLPEPIRAAILAMIHSATECKG